MVVMQDRSGKRRCDQSCHDAAAGTPCACICGGRWHARGEQAVQEAARELRAIALGNSGALSVSETTMMLARAARDKRFYRLVKGAGELPLREWSQVDAFIRAQLARIRHEQRVARREAGLRGAA